MRFYLSAAFALLTAFFLAQAAHAQPARTVYTCVDSKGQTLTSDRPIMECWDRPQRELSASGTLIRIIPPRRSPAEMAAFKAEERNRLEAERREQDRARRVRALLVRYPDRAAHDAARQQALLMVDSAIASALERLDELEETRAQLEKDMDDYASPEKVPAEVKRQHENVASDVRVQKEFLDARLAERKRIEAQFDEELQPLEAAWRKKSEGANPGM